MNLDAARRLVLAPFLLAASLALLAPPASAAETPAVVGTWDAVAATPNGELPSVITVKQVEGQIKAEIEIEGTQRTVSDEKLEGNLLKMKVQYEGNVYDVEAKVVGEGMEGSWVGGGNSGTFKAKRRP
jgi:hypothetical protein